MKKTNNKKKKNPYSVKSISIVVYPESCPDLDFVINTLPIKRYAYILHNKDLNENNEIKKPHFHLIIQFTKAVNTNALLKKLGLSIDFLVQPLGDWTSMIRYFQHLDNPEKTQYSYEEIITNYNVSIFENNTIGDYCDKEYKASCKLQEILKIIDSISWKFNGFIPQDFLLDTLIKKRLVLAYRQFFYIVRDYIADIEGKKRSIDYVINGNASHSFNES